MWVYERKLQYPVKLKNTNPKLASVILSQLGGPDGEMGAATRYLNQRYSMKDGIVIGTLTDIGSEELGHAEMVASIVHQLTRNLTPDEVKAGGMDKYFVDHTLGVFPASADGVPFTTAYIGVKGDPVADLDEDLAAEQKARVTYDNILRLSDDPDVNEVIKFLRQREVVHYQRFGEALRRVTEGLDQKNYYAFNPSYNCKKG